jgi:ADP-ribose pyrophosphatase YjhB (NUDIX family)
LVSSINEIVAPLVLQAEEVVVWPPSTLRVRTFLTPTLPPLDLVTSVRAVVRQGDQVLVVRDPVTVHILPGGRREANESLLHTLAREVQEETGWMIEDERLLGLLHFRHLTPRPDGYRYHYPDFLHLVYAATAGRYDARLREVDGYELEAGFQPSATVLTLPLSRGERALLRAAMSMAEE